MNLVWKVLLGLAVLLPIGAYAAGALGSAQVPPPTPREPVVLQDAPTRPAPATAPAGRAGDGDDRGGDRD